MVTCSQILRSKLSISAPTLVTVFEGLVLQLIETKTNKNLLVPTCWNPTSDEDLYVKSGRSDLTWPSANMWRPDLTQIASNTGCSRGNWGSKYILLYYYTVYLDHPRGVQWSTPHYL